jgi:serine/threonine protein kinase/Flp pilus assembly protein TadD
MTQAPSHRTSRTGTDSALSDLFDDLIRRVQAGEYVDLQDYIARHPDHASELRQVFPAIEMLVQLGQSGASGPVRWGDSTVGESSPGCDRGALGDFRILREIARGGMGVVFEAEQISLGRRVALKVLPFAAMLDPKQLQRFKNEAMAAASLDHPNIVHVYFVGSDRSVHFYAMQFIDGCTLADVVRDLRQTEGRDRASGKSSPMDGVTATPSPSSQSKNPRSEFLSLGANSQNTTHQAHAIATRMSSRPEQFFHEVARLGLQAAEALQHAHERGVRHRDVKPSNLLVDSTGKLWVTDFGLAQFQSGSGLTMTGDIIGTLRYMSPEQALGHRELVDHRTDIYSLGVTLYELLTFELAFSSDDRQEFLRQIAFEEPRPLRSVNASIPRDLETIVLKAISREPSSRYSSAQELADEFRRFLEDQPIVAKRPTVVDRLKKWTYRHKTTVSTATVVAVFVLAVSSVLIWREKERTQTALAQAKSDREDARAQQQEAEGNAAYAELQRKRAEDNFRKALQAVTDLYEVTEASEISNVSEMNLLKVSLSDTAVRLFHGFVDDKSNDPLVQLQTGCAYVHLAGMYFFRRNHEESGQCYRRAVAVFSQLANEFPADHTYRLELAEAHNHFAMTLLARGRSEPATEQFQAAVQQFCQAVQLEPDNVSALNHYAWFLATCPDVALRDPETALECTKKALEQNPRAAGCWEAQGAALYRVGNYTDAVTALENSITLSSRPRNDASYFLAMAYFQLGDKERSLSLFDEVRRRMARERTPDLRGFAAEAARLLGVTEVLTMSKGSAEERAP